MCGAGGWEEKKIFKRQKRESTNKFHQILIKYNSKESTEVYMSCPITIRSAGISCLHPRYQEKKIRTHMTASISLYVSKQLLITELYWDYFGKLRLVAKINRAFLKSTLKAIIHASWQHCTPSNPNPLRSRCFSILCTIFGSLESKITLNNT